MARRILLLITDLEIGGTPTVVRELALRLAPLGHIEVACLSRWGPVADHLTQAGVAVTALGAAGPRDVIVLPRLRRLIRRQHIDTLFSFLLHANAAAAAMKLACPGLRVLHSYQTAMPHPAWHWRLHRLIHPAADAVVVPSPSVAAMARRAAGVPLRKIHLIPNAIDPDAFPHSPIPGAQPAPYPIGFIGRLDPIKAVPDLVAAVAPLVPHVHLHLFGDGPDRARIEAAIRHHRLADHVTLHGVIPRPHEALQRLGLLVLPSTAEGFGLVLIEAMAAGVPVVARNVPGVRDVVHHGRTGLLAADLSNAALTEAIRRVIQSPTLRASLIGQGSQEVRRRYTWPAVLPHYARLLCLPAPQS